VAFSLTTLNVIFARLKFLFLDSFISNLNVTSTGNPCSKESKVTSPPAAASVPLVVYYFQIKHKVTKPFSLQKSFALLYFQSSGFSTKPETTGVNCVRKVCSIDDKN